MYYYVVEHLLAASFLSDLPFPSAAPGIPRLFLLRRNPKYSRAAFRVTQSHQLTDDRESVLWLNRQKNDSSLPPEVLCALNAGTLTAVNLNHPRWKSALSFLLPKQGKKRIHLLGVGDVGGILLTALKLLGGDFISHIGIYDQNEHMVARWLAEMGQIAWPWVQDTLLNIEAISPAHLFDCDVLIFAATKAIPPIDSNVPDVRMAQFEANRPLIETVARQARSAKFKGLFIVLSDPVDPLCKAAWLASNQNVDRNWDGLGLLPEQIQGYGLGVMDARAAYFAKQDARFASFLKDGRSFGVHGNGLVIANSIEQYDDVLSRELTELVKTANLQIRKLGFKPYVAPAISSGAIQLLLTLRGAWHCGSVYLGGVWFGVRNRYTAYGLETESLPLPDALLQRLLETERELSTIL